MENIYYTRLLHDEWPIYLAATERGLCYVSGIDESFEEVKERLKKWLPNAYFIESASQLKTYEKWFVAYFNGEEPAIEFELDVYGTAFQRKVWMELATIRYGEIVTYSDIAVAIQNEKGVRAVGKAIGMNPLTIVLPCHRVIGKNGDLTGFRGGIPMKIKLLQLENSTLL